MTVTSTGNITTAGINAAGIDASSTGAVTVTSTGNITTAGNGCDRDLCQQHRHWRGHGDLDRQHHHRGRQRVGIYARSTALAR